MVSNQDNNNILGLYLIQRKVLNDIYNTNNFFRVIHFYLYELGTNFSTVTDD